MSRVDIDTPAGSKYLLDLFVAEMARNLTDAAIAHIRPRIYAAAKEAVASIEPQLRAHHDMLADRLIVNFVGVTEGLK